MTTSTLMAWLHGAIAVFQKDARLELRTRFALNALGLFVIAAVLVVRFAVGNSELSHETQAALLWIVILFAAVVGLGRAFIVEEERGTVLLLRLALPLLELHQLAFEILAKSRALLALGFPTHQLLGEP
ncbi:MAG: heme exporter protein CcmB, partial [Rubricoccaceae bacterium]|nr:heme exporter protein CcmB [Rubricoccaceae bacterium]